MQLTGHNRILLVSLKSKRCIDGCPNAHFRKARPSEPARRGTRILYNIYLSALHRDYVR